MSDYWENQKVQPDFKTWIETWHDSIICGCDHGCNGWLAQNAGKAYRIIQYFYNSKECNSHIILDSIVKEHVNEVNRSIVEDRLNEFREEREKKDENS